MYLSPSLLLLPLLVAADQVPLRDQAAGWFDKAKAFVSGAAEAIPDLPNPIDAGAAKVAANVVERINIRNWQRKMAPKPDIEEEWLLYLTGGNKTCFGKCGPMDAVWNQSVPLLSALTAPAGSPRLRLGILDCEKDEVLCTAWATGCPVVYHFLIPPAPAAGKEPAPVSVHIIPLNMSEPETSDFTSIPSRGESRYLKYDEFNGMLHPFDGVLAKTGLLQPFGYFMWAVGSMPGWVMMLGISFVSRQIMSKRMARIGTTPDAAAAAPGGAGAGAVPAPRAVPATGSQPKGPGSAKKRK